MSSIESFSLNSERKAGDDWSDGDVARRREANEKANDDVDNGGGAADNDNVNNDERHDDKIVDDADADHAVQPIGDMIASIEASSTPQKDLHRRLFEEFVRSSQGRDELLSRKIIDDARFERLVQLLTDKDVEAAATATERFQAKSFHVELVEGGATRVRRARSVFVVRACLNLFVRSSFESRATTCDDALCRRANGSTCCIRCTRDRRHTAAFKSSKTCSRSARR